MILADTSAWVDFFKNTKPLADIVDGLLLENQIVICGPIETEIRRGFRSEKERQQVLPLFKGCGYLEQPANLWNDAGELGFLLRRKGRTIKTFDLLIAVYALTHETTLLTRDQDFTVMRKSGIPLNLYEF